METNSKGLRVSFSQNLHLLNSCKVLRWALPFNFIRWFTIGRKGYVQQVGGQCRSWIILTKPHNNAFYLSTRHTSARQSLRSGYTRVISLLATRKLSITFPIFKGIENVFFEVSWPSFVNWHECRLNKNFPKLIRSVSSVNVALTMSVFIVAHALNDVKDGGSVFSGR